MDHISIAKNAIPNIRRILGDEFKYITDAPPEVKFTEYNGDFTLTSITFFAHGDFADTICVNGNSVTLMTEEGADQELCQFHELSELLSLTKENVAELRPDMAEAVTAANQARKKTDYSPW